jgi:hypothetical protein
LTFTVRRASKNCELGSASLADLEFQRDTQLSRPRLTVLLNSPLEKRLASKTKRGRKGTYSVAPYVKLFLV